MTLENLASIGEIVSSIAVVISLVYLAVQIRSNTEAGRSATYQAIVSDFGALNNTMASTPELSHLFCFTSIRKAILTKKSGSAGNA
jgi:hypothetical protein